MVIIAMSNLVGARLRRIRTNRGVSQETLAERAEVSQSWVSAVENGTSDPGIDSLARVARVLNVSLDYLAYGEEPGGGVSIRVDPRHAAAHQEIEQAGEEFVQDLWRMAANFNRVQQRAKGDTDQQIEQVPDNNP